MKIGFLGPKASFTYAAATTAFPEEQHELMPFDTITEVIRSYESGLVDFAIVPVENSIEGSVHQTIDYLFLQADNLHTQAEIILPIRQQLMATDNQKKIEKIFSHPQAIAQWKNYIKAHFPHAKIETTASTAFAARYVADNPDQPYAAIAPHAAAKEYGLEILAKDIQEIEKNYTRFWLLGSTVPEIPLNQINCKLTLALTLPDNMPGALYKALSTFAWRGIDLTKIESRPLKTVLGEYFFIIDCDYTKEKLAQFALEELTAVGIGYKILGAYQVYEI